MKSFHKLLLILLMLVTAQTAQAQETAQAKPKAAGTEQVQFKTSAVCDMCKARLEKAMAYEKGVKSSTLDLANQVLTVQYLPGKTTPEVLRTAIQRTGYDADDQLAETRAYDRLPECCKKTNAVH